ncbi:hypothetical protein LR48_Vigan09g057800 [Vigna angularis]|uniref:Uncharacterized protein n=1 Tax=Phaseolus angularis TaxID=3914 RepID=A0A0L9VB91_PHAAN|nr:hypothetical protein LR48_Vigan09g057800 [Vigna angularis]
MTPKDLEAVRIINALPRRHTRGFVECLGHEDFDQMAFATCLYRPPTNVRGRVVPRVVILGQLLLVARLRP